MSREHSASAAGRQDEARIDAPDILSHAPWGAMLLRGGRVVWMNERLASWLGAVPGELVGAEAKADEDRWPPGLFDSHVESLEIGRAPAEILHLRRHWQAGADGGEIHYFEDRTEHVRLERENQRLRADIRTLEGKDAETGLLNRYAVLRDLENQISRSRRYGNPLAAIRLNITPPEAGGESDFKTLAQDLNALLRWTDRIGRLEDCDFLLVLPETAEANARFLAEELSGGRFAQVYREAGWRIEAIAAAWRPGDDARKLLRRLDESAG